MSPQPNACPGNGDSPKRPGARRSAMCLALAAVGALPASEAMAAVTRVVTTCADSTALPDCSTGDDITLRKALFCAQNKDIVDLTQLQCSTITLAESLVAGTISVTVNGPGRDKLTIDAGYHSRAFIHNGVNANTLTINKLTIVNGHYDNPYNYSNGGGCIYSSASVALNAVTCQPGRSLAIASAMAPEPVPRSATRADGPGISSKARSTSNSVSGLGTSTAGVTARRSVQKSLNPRI